VPDRASPEPDDLVRAGVYDPDAPGAADRLQLIRYVLERGATLEEVASSRSLGNLALDLNVRARPTLTVAEVTASTGLGQHDALQLLSALGLPLNPGQTMTTDEAEVVAFLANVRSLLGPTTTTQVARVAGTAMARVADVLVTAIRLAVELPRLSAGTAYSDLVKQYGVITEDFLPTFVRMLDVLLRRQLVDVAERAWSNDEDQTAVTLPRTIGFADMVDYTAASTTMSAAELSAVLAAFDEVVTSVVHAGGGQLIKTIGDEAMFAAESARDACRIALSLLDGLDGAGLPSVRIGLASGEILSVLGDLFGPDVNLAARLADAAAPSCVLVSESVHASCAGLFSFEFAGTLSLKGFEGSVPAYRLLPIS
jgi:adenylate cyclase